MKSISALYCIVIFSIITISCVSTRETDILSDTMMPENEQAEALRRTDSHYNYTRIQNAISSGTPFNEKQYVKVDIGKNAIYMSWDEIPKEELVWDHNYHFNQYFVNAISIRGTGYLVYLVEKDKSYKSGQFFNLLFMPDKIKRKIFFTKDKCLLITDIDTSKEYYLSLNVVLDGELDGEFENMRMIGIKRFYEIGQQRYLNQEISSFERFAGAKDKAGCKSEILKISLKDLYANRQKYIGKFLEIEGFRNRTLESYGNIKGPEYMINAGESRSDTGISGGQYGLYVEGLYGLHEIVGYEPVWKEKNYIRILVYFTGEKDIPKKENPRYKAYLVSINSLIKK